MPFQTNHLVFLFVLLFSLSLSVSLDSLSVSSGHLVASLEKLKSLTCESTRSSKSVARSNSSGHTGSLPFQSLTHPLYLHNKNKNKNKKQKTKNKKQKVWSQGIGFGGNQGIENSGWNETVRAEEQQKEQVFDNSEKRGKRFYKDLLGNCKML